MTFQQLTDGLKRVYAYLVVGTALGIRLPWWILSSLLPAQRPRRSWALGKCLNLKFTRFMFSRLGNSHKNILYTTPTHRELQIGQGIKGVYVDGVPELITGKVKEWAAKANVEAIRLPGYWMHKKGEDIIMGQKPDACEKVAYFLHGGGYVLLSAHPDQLTSNIPRGFLEFCPSIKRTFAIEYRLSSVPPAPTEGQFPSALIDALAGYSYLVHDVGFTPAQIVLVGDSAGGNLAQALTRYLVEYGGAVPGLPSVPGALVMLSPWVDMSGSTTTPTSSIFTNQGSDYLIEPSILNAPRTFIEPFGMGFAFETPYLSPACTQLEDVNFEGFPRTFVSTGDAEMLLDQIRLFQKRMEKKLGEDKVVYFEAKDAFHDYLCIPTAEPERTETLKAISAFVEA